MLYNPFKPPPAPPAFGEGNILPERSASFLSQLIFYWLNPFLTVGFSRPLQKEDFWQLPHNRLTASITDSLERNFYSRCTPESRPRFIREKLANFSKSGSSPGASNDQDRSDKSETFAEVPTDDLENKPNPLGKKHKWFKKSLKKDTQQIPVYDQSLFKAIHETFFVRIWVAGLFNLLSDTLKTTTPLLNKVILTWLAESYAYWHLTDAEKALAGIKAPRGIGYGIGLAVALFVMQEAASLMTNQYMQVSMITGLSVRAGLIGSIFRKSLRLSGRARIDHDVGHIMTMISTDTTRLDLFAAYGHNLWVSPIQLAVGVGLLIGNMGYSALVGLGVLIVGMPLQALLIVIIFNQRKKGVKITDTRVRLTTEVLQGIRLIKAYGWEAFYTQQIGKLREREIATIRQSLIALALLIAMVTFIPVLASVLTFVTYSLTGHDLNIAIIFSSLQLFNIIRAPLIIFPFVVSSLSDALVALIRISKFLTAEELEESYLIDHRQEAAVIVDGDFVWEHVLGLEDKGGKFSDTDVPVVPLKDKNQNQTKPPEAKVKKTSRLWRRKTKANLTTLPTSSAQDDTAAKEQDKKEEDSPFELKELKFRIKKGSFIGIVGRVGSGKSSVLQALIGEMRCTRGNVTFGGSVGYVPQIPWIRNATLRENILFGQDDDENRFRAVVAACSLEHDLETLPLGEHTEIGEKGINLSGGQKARVSLARAAYSQSDIVLLDDPLSAVDSHVGKNILENCLLKGPLADRTRLLVTHALHVLDKTDYIYVIDTGCIVEEGTYEDLMANSVLFSPLMNEHGNLDHEKSSGEPSKLSRQNGGIDKNYEEDDRDISKSTTKLMQEEERNIGSVDSAVYEKYLKAAGGVIWAPVIILLLVLSQAAQVGNNLFLGFWTADSISGFNQTDYIIVYAALGLAQAVFSYFVTFCFAIVGLIASLKLFRSALNAVLRSPTSFFDTTPMGRILSRLSKDQDTIDGELPLSMMQFLSTFSTVLGTIALVFYTFPYLGIIFLPMSILYYIISIYYRKSSVETKRLDSLMRSTLYGSYSETLTGLSTIRAYREQARSIKGAEYGLDMENRAYYMTISIQRWLAVRLDLFGNILIFGIALFGAGFRHTVNPAKIGVVLSYTLGITQVLAEMVSQFALNEQNMNAVERILHYSELPSEGEAVTKNDPPLSWPNQGEIVFEGVELSYRPELPFVLKGVSFKINPGEKVGIVGRTGAGKSSLLQAIFRMAPIHDGKIEIDGYNITEIGLDVLRNRLALVPQDTNLFLGTLRENLDPQKLRTDAELITVLQRACLLPSDGPIDLAIETKFSLDSTVGDEGGNFSAGEKQLLSLCRALVKNSRIIILDEATSSVDVETDARIQRTIQSEFGSSTLLCIAHRLNTIAYYDRVLVMDQGQVAEFDTVLNLFDKRDSIFRSLCNEANLARPDIEKIRAEHASSTV